MASFAATLPCEVCFHHEVQQNMDRERAMNIYVCVCIHIQSCIQGYTYKQSKYSFIKTYTAHLRTNCHLHENV